MGGIVVALTCGCPPDRPEVGAQPRAESGDETIAVARINGEVITARDYESRIESMPDFARTEFASVPRRKQYLAPLVEFELLADAAEKKGYGDDPRVIHVVKEHLAERAVADADRQKLLEELRAKTPPKMDVSAVERALSEKSK